MFAGETALPMGAPSRANALSRDHCP